MADLCADADQHGGVGARAVLALLSLSRAVLSALPRRDAPRPGALHPAARRAEPPPLPRTKWTRRVPHSVLIGHAASLSQAAVQYVTRGLCVPVSRVLLLGQVLEAPSCLLVLSTC